MTQAIQNVTAATPPKACTPADWTILVVEDDPTMQDLLVLLLTEEHYHVLAASSGEAALALLEQQHQVPRVLLLDYQLAGRMDGIELYDQLHARPGWRHICAILMSANLPPEEAICARHLIGLAKPFDIDVLLEHVAAVASNAAISRV